MDLGNIISEIEELECVDNVKTEEVEEGIRLHVFLGMEYNKSHFEKQSENWGLYNEGSYKAETALSTRTVVKRLYVKD
jgi:hypothetical protein